MTKNLLVIAVHNRRLTRHPDSCRFIALSHVYGGIKVPQNAFLRHDLSCPLRTYDLGTRPQKTPALQDECICACFEQLNCLLETIEDTILLIRLLRFKYLWVDSICFNLQGTDKQSNSINSMISTFKTAFVTIVAAAGINVNSGLPGVTPGSRNSVYHEETI